MSLLLQLEQQLRRRETQPTNRQVLAFLSPTYSSRHSTRLESCHLLFRTRRWTYSDVTSVLVLFYVQYVVWLRALRAASWELVDREWLGERGSIEVPFYRLPGVNLAPMLEATAEIVAHLFCRKNEDRLTGIRVARLAFEPTTFGFIRHRLGALLAPLNQIRAHTSQWTRPLPV